MLSSEAILRKRRSKLSQNTHALQGPENCFPSSALASWFDASRPNSIARTILHSTEGGSWHKRLVGGGDRKRKQNWSENIKEWTRVCSKKSIYNLDAPDSVKCLTSRVDSWWLPRYTGTHVYIHIYKDMITRGEYAWDELVNGKSGLQEETKTRRTRTTINKGEAPKKL